MSEHSEHYTQGFETGRGAGSWIIDGNTTPETAARILRGHEDGDPEIMDMQPAPLNGEWGGESMPELIDDYFDMTDEDAEAACDEYEAGFADGFWHSVLTSAKVLVDA